MSPSDARLGFRHPAKPIGLGFPAVRTLQGNGYTAVARNLDHGNRIRADVYRYIHPYVYVYTYIYVGYIYIYVYVFVCIMSLCAGFTKVKHFQAGGSHVATSSLRLFGVLQALQQHDSQGSVGRLQLPFNPSYF